MTARTSIRITGIVQGVGFRPHVFRLAQELGIGGSIRNDVDGVLIHLAGDERALAEFCARLRREPPPLARIDSFTLGDGDPCVSAFEFVIEDSLAGGVAQVVVSPDKSICPQCLADIRNPADRHFGYPFTNCCNCGPRYTLIRALPYDRKHTSMAGFAMCSDCAQSYHDPLDRRYHAQPVSCLVCGPRLSLTDRQGNRECSDSHKCLDRSAQLLRDGAIFAIKGLGGFHLVCDARNAQAVETLRARKQRPAKPLAVMVRDLAEAKTLALGCEPEWQLLDSRERPIVVLQKHPSCPMPEAIAPDIDRIGLFQPYTPLHALLLDRLHGPLVATSANRSGEPIIIEAAEVYQRLAEVVDYVLDHDRPIVSGCDDSVVQWAGGQLQVLRLARGYAPLALPSPQPLPKQLLAVGPQQKNTLGFGVGQNLLLSPHIGDLFSLEAEDYFARTLDSFRRLYDVRPELVVADRHPDYAPSRFARDLVAADDQRRLMQVQHHFAHVLAVMAGNQSAGPVLGFSFDGTGLGDDASLWGGEVMIATAHSYQRVGGLAPFALPGGDKASHEPWRLVIALLGNRLGAESLLALPCLAHLSERQLANHLRVAASAGVVKSSSMGRLFDAAAAMLGLCNHIQFEGQAGMLLEAAAAKALAPWPPLTLITGEDGRWDGAALLLAMHQCLMADDPLAPEKVKGLAAAFLQAVADAVIRTAQRYPQLPVVLCGGVFQNRTLCNLTVSGLQQSGLTVLPWGQVPVNDGGIALGQLWYAAHSFR